MTDDIRKDAITTYTNRLQMNRMSATLGCVLATLPKINHKFAKMKMTQVKKDFCFHNRNIDKYCEPLYYVL